MRKQLPVICVAAGIVLLAACTNDGGQQQTTVAPQPAVCNGPTVEISGAEPRYEPLNPTANRDYQRDGKSYKIVQDPSRFSRWLAAIYDAEPGSNLTASGRCSIRCSLPPPIRHCLSPAMRESPTRPTVA